MNIANLLINAAPILPGKGTQQLKREGVTSFQHVLHSSIQLHQGKSNSFFTEEELFVLEEGLPSLETTVQEILNNIPIDKGYLTLEMVTVEEAHNFLRFLPEEMQENIISLFHSNIPIEGLVQETEEVSVENFISLVLALQAVKPENAAVNTLSNYAKQFLPMSWMDSLHESKSLKQWVEKWTELLSKVNEQSVQQKKEPLTKMSISNWLSNVGFEGEAKNKMSVMIDAYPTKATVSTQPSGLMAIDLSQPLNRLQQFVIHVGENQTQHAQARDFIRQFQDLMNRSNFANINGMKQLTIKLFPEHLGRLDIQLRQVNGVITATISATTKAAKELIDSQVQQLRSAFIQQQLQVEKIEVIQHQSFEQTTKDGRERNEQSEKEDKDDATEDINDSFRDVLAQFNIEV